MSCSSLRTRLSLLGTPVFGSRRARGWSALTAIAGTIILAPPSHDTVVAQATPAPAVRVVRDVRFEGQVWPTDINGDGVTDLISSSETRFVNGVQTGGMVQALGRGDGTFDNPVVSSFKGNAVGATDFNGDGNRDVIAKSAIDATGAASFVILPGNGTTALGAPRTIGPASEASFALTADMNGDGKRDVITEGSTA